MSRETHLTDEVLFEFAAGRLAGAEAEATHAHLDSCADCRTLLAAASQSVTSRDSFGEKANGAMELALPVGRGTLIGRYLVREVLGAGAMGVVYSAWDPDLERLVAIKLVHESAARAWSPVREDRLRREARVMARLVHPNVVRVYDVGEHGARTFIAMELIEGRTLTEWLGEKPRSTSEIVQCFVAAGRGLWAAHEAGLLHRDFKPDNVLVARDGRVVVGDFGLAREAERGEPVSDPALDPGAPAVHSGRIAGTPAYLAPEVIAGYEPTTSSDLFSYCVSLWEGLHGQRPFTGRTPFALHEQIRSRKPEPASSRVPARLRKILLRGLDPDPEARHSSMAALLKELDRTPRRVRLLGAAAVLALVALAALGMEAGRSERVRCSGGRRHLEAAWGAERRSALAAAFTAAGQGAVWPAIERALDRFGDSWVEVHADSCRATRIEGHQSEELLQRRSKCLAEQREVVAALGDVWLSGTPALLAKAPSAIQALPLPCACGGDALLNAPVMKEPAPAIAGRVEDVRRRLAGVKGRLAAADPQTALDEARAAVETAKQIGYAPLEAEALLALASAFKYHGDFNGVEHTAQEAMLAAVAAEHEQALAEAMVLLAANAIFDRGRLDEGEQLLARATPVAARLNDRRLLADLEVARGRVRFERGDVEGAQAIYAALLPHAESVFGREHPQVARLEGYLFQCAFRMGCPEEAREHAEREVAILERTLPPDHLSLYPALMDRAVPEYDLGNVTAARALFERALRIAEKAQGPEGPGVAATLGNLANVLATEGETQASRATAEKALAIAIKTRGMSHPLTAYLELVLGDTSWESGALAEATPHLARALELREAKYGRHHVDTAEVLARVGRARIDSGDAGGLAQVLEAEQIVRELPANSSRREHTARFACEALIEARRLDEAEPFCQRMLTAAHEGRDVNHPWVINARRILAEMDLQRGRTPDRAMLERGIAALEKRGGWPRLVAEAQFALAEALAAGRNPADRLRAAQLARTALAAEERMGARRPRLETMMAFVEKGAEHALR